MFLVVISSYAASWFPIQQVKVSIFLRMKIKYILFVCTIMMFLVVTENNGKMMVVLVTLKEIWYQK